MVHNVPCSLTKTEEFYQFFVIHYSLKGMLLLGSNNFLKYSHCLVQSVDKLAFYIVVVHGLGLLSIRQVLGVWVVLF